MSYGNEYMAEHEYERDEAMKRWESICTNVAMEASHGIWHTLDGRIMHVEEMETEHIRNCIRMLKRNNNPFWKFYKPMFEGELAKRGESV